MKFTKATQILDWFVWCVSFAFAGLVLLAVESIFTHFNNDDKGKMVIIFLFFVALTQIGLFISPWAVRSENFLFKILTAISMLPAIIVFISLFISDILGSLNLGFSSDYSRSTNFEIVILLFILILYGIQLFRLLYFKHVELGIFKT